GAAVRQRATAAQPGGQVDGDERLADAGVAVEQGQLAPRQVRLPQPAEGFGPGLRQGVNGDGGHAAPGGTGYYTNIHLSPGVSNTSGQGCHFLCVAMLAILATLWRAACALRRWHGGAATVGSSVRLGCPCPSRPAAGSSPLPLPFAPRTPGGV